MLPFSYGLATVTYAQLTVQANASSNTNLVGNATLQVHFVHPPLNLLTLSTHANLCCFCQCAHAAACLTPTGPPPSLGKIPAACALKGLQATDGSAFTKLGLAPVGCCPEECGVLSCWCCCSR